MFLAGTRAIASASLAFEVETGACSCLSVLTVGPVGYDPRAP